MHCILNISEVVSLEGNFSRLISILLFGYKNVLIATPSEPNTMFSHTQNKGETYYLCGLRPLSIVFYTT